MKLIHSLTIATCILAMSACSSDEVLVQTGPKFEGDGEMSVVFHSTSTITRADSEYEEGTGNESKINDATLYFFSSTGATTPYQYKYLGSGNAVVLGTATGGSTGIEQKITIEVSGDVISKSPTHVVAVINKSSEFKTAVGSLTAESTYANFNKALDVSIDNCNFMMTSSTAYTGDAEVTLTPITDGMIVKKGSSTAPTDCPIYIERACAKVTFSTASTIGTPTGDKAAKVDFRGWGLNVLNKKYYPVKTLQTGWETSEGSGTPSMFWSTDDFSNAAPTTDTWKAFSEWIPAQIEGEGVTQPSTYRCFWAVDPNYAHDSETDLSSVYTYKKISDAVNAAGTSLYCPENTMSAKGQYQNQTTSVLVLAQYTPNSVMTTDDTHCTWFLANSKYYKESQLLTEVFQKYLDGTHTTYYTNSEHTTEVTASNLALTYTTKSITINGASTAVGVTAIGIGLAGGVTLYDDSGNEVTGDAKTTYLEAIKSAATSDFWQNIKCFYNGFCYYSAPIPHFTSTTLVEGTDEACQPQLLGRYGVVRNHVYKIVLQSILNPGTPISEPDKPVTPPTDPDDSDTYQMLINAYQLDWHIVNYNLNL